MTSNFGTFDIETKNWKDFLLMGSYNGKIYKEHTSMENFIEHCFLSGSPASTYYAHFGGIFDFLFVFDFLFSKNSPLKIKGIIMQGRKILAFTINHSQIKRNVKFVCSSGLFPFSLKELTHSFDVEHKKLDEDVTLFKKVTPQMQKYLFNDVMGLYEAIEKFSQTDFIRDIGIKLTRSGTSFEVFKKCFKPKLPFIPNDIKDFARLSYFGGRTEIFRPLYQGKKPINCYDINSLYPSVMHDFEYPGEFSHWQCDLCLDEFSISHCLVTCPENIKIPLLGTKINDKYIFPTGTFEGHFTNVELKKAIDLGYKIEKVYRTAVFKNAKKIFKEFISFFYNERKKTDCPVKKIVYKDLMNHLYGRLAINEERESITLTPSEASRIYVEFIRPQGNIRLYSEQKKLFTYSNVVFSSFVTSYARLRLFSYLEILGDDLYYCDTDSVFTTRKLENSKELGKMKLEYSMDEACFLLPKTYMLKNKQGDVIKKMKGFPKKNLGHIQFSDYIGCMEGSIRMPAVKTSGGLAGLKTALKKGEILTVLPDSQKQLRHKYDKREIYKKKNKYFTKPIRAIYQESLF